MNRLHRRHAWRGKLILLLVLFGLILVAYKLLPGQHISQTLQQNQPGLYGISRFIDGDTVAVNMDGRVETVRFIGIDTPETHKPNTPVQCFGPAAAEYTKMLIGKNRIRLVSDSLNTDRDRYNRLLRYVYLPDGTDLNEKLVRDGYAFYYPYFPFSKAEQFDLAEQTAIATHRGIWAKCQPTRTESGGYLSNPA